MFTRTWKGIGQNCFQLLLNKKVRYRNAEIMGVNVKQREMVGKVVNFFSKD